MSQLTLSSISLGNSAYKDVGLNSSSVAAGDTASILTGYILGVSGGLQVQIGGAGISLGQFNALSGNVGVTGQTLDNKINSLSGYVNNLSLTGAAGGTGTLVKVTGSANLTTANFSGVGGTVVALVGNTVTISGAGGVTQAQLDSLSGVALQSGTFYLSGNFPEPMATGVSGLLIQTSGVLRSLIGASAAGVSTLNGASGALNIIGTGGITVSNVGQNIYISGGNVSATGTYTIGNIATFGNAAGTLLYDAGATAVSGIVFSAGPTDSGKVPLLDASGQLNRTFFDNGVVITSGVQTLTGKTINGNNNTLIIRNSGDTTGNLPIYSFNSGINANTGTFWRGDGSWQTITGGSSLPVQSGHAGQFLTTDGTNPSWASVSGGIGGSGYVTIQDEGSSLIQRSIINFVGAGVTATDDGSAKTTITINGGGAGGTKTIAVFTPRDAQPPATNYALFDTRNSVALLVFDAAASWSSTFVSIIPESATLTSGLKIEITWTAASATSGSVIWGAKLNRLGGTNNIDTDSYDSVATATTATSGTNGRFNITEITLTTINSIVAGETYKLNIYRDAAAGGDTMSGNAQIVSVEVRTAN